MTAARSTAPDVIVPDVSSACSERTWREPIQKDGCSDWLKPTRNSTNTVYGGGQWVDNPDYDPAAPRMDGDWENWNPKKIWVPSKEGLGMKKVLDDFNQLYPKTPIKYE